MLRHPQPTDAEATGISRFVGAVWVAEMGASLRIIAEKVSALVAWEEGKNEARKKAAL
jgi:hypothetical protein